MRTKQTHLFMYVKQVYQMKGTQTRKQKAYFITNV